MVTTRAESARKSRVVIRDIGESRASMEASMTIFLAQLRKIFIYKVASLDLKTRQIEKFKMYSLRAETKSMIS